mmetsp:Transcript_9217/g.15254  ORF Transcript_9217/g.15254 Transcript_9217/m.15254 type:complete len:596 (+) Transcript_9217:1909-3696(+)
MTNGRGRGGSNKSRQYQKKQQHQLQNSTQQQQQSSSSSHTSSSFSLNNYSSYNNNYTYNPAGYSSYTTNGRYHSTSSCRVIYGRVEAYTTKRAGSDKKTAYQVGENYAHEMHKLNEAVESMKRERRISGGEVNELLDDGHGNVGGGVKEEPKQQEGKKSRATTSTTTTTTGRRRSRSVDGVTFASSPLRPLETLMENSPLNIFDGEDDTTKRPLEGILKEPSSNKRSRAISFDISTGPSTSSSRRYTNRTESSSSLMAGTTWGSGGVVGQWGTMAPSSTAEEDNSNTHPLIPQPSLYQSSFGEGGNSKTASSLPTIAPRRLVTDLILTLNASFPDYDFGDARPSDFCTLPVPEAMRRINDKLSEFAATTDRGQDFLPRFWSSLDDVVLGLKDAEVYSYAPQAGDDDPLEFLTMSMAGGNEAGDGGFLPSTTTAGNSGGSRFVSGDALNCLDTSNVLSLPDRIPTSKADDSAHVTLWSMNYFFVSGNKKRIVLFACVECIGNQGDGSGDDDVVDDYEYGENDVVFDEARRGKRQEEKEERSVIGSPSPLESFSVAGDESVSVMVEDYGVDMDGGDEDQGENDFDTGALGTSVHPMT